ncbi:MAG TPA: hypothetical protein VGB46_08840 [Flavisolibacter sp.]
MLLLLSVLLFSCSTNETEEGLAKAGGMAVVFYGAPGGSDDILGPQNKVVEATDKKAIRKLAAFVSGKETGKKNCTADGAVFFIYDKNTSVKVDFHLLPDCRYFTYTINGQPHTTAMSHEAADFLEALKQGRASY